ncbi:hypothetical protein [Maribacter sp. 2307ULW6-5]|uniref:hypothetical protein n=1 Tax=Maribacter sp. 2307ULW6-5 TaxID=3386275 RepID=UPI0039BD48E3
MSSIRDLKKDINNVLGSIIEAVYIVEAANGQKDSKEGSKIIDDAIAVFDDLIGRVNDRGVDNRKAHLKAVRNDLEAKAKGLAEQVNALG